MADNSVEVYVTGSEVNAQQAAGILESNGIKHFLKMDVTQHLFGLPGAPGPFDTMSSGHRILVPEEEAERATELIHAYLGESLPEE